MPLLWFLGCLLSCRLVPGLQIVRKSESFTDSLCSGKNQVCRYKPIAEVRVGEWVVATNPAIEDEEEDSLVAGDVIRAEEWRKISLRMTKQDGDELRMEFLRPVEWIESHEVVAGGKIGIELGEMRRRPGRRAGGRAQPADRAASIAPAPIGDWDLRPFVRRNSGRVGRGS